MYLKKLIGIFIMTLLIGTVVLPVNSTMNVLDSNIKIKTSLSPGDYLRFMFFDMSLRSYRFHIPPSYDGMNPMPLVFALHGYSQNSTACMLFTKLNEKADEEGFIVVYPNGGTDLYFLLACKNLHGWGYWGFYWNCWDALNYDEVGFFKKLIDTFQSEYNIDEHRIYVTGFSNGGEMAYRLGADFSNIIAAIAPVAGSIGGKWNYNQDEKYHGPFYIIPEPEHPLPVVVFHGMKDQSVPYEGMRDPLTDEIILYSVNESVAFWVEYNNCDPIPLIDTIYRGSVITRTYTNGSQNSEVVLYTVVNRGHDWFWCCNDLIWEFFEAHPKQ